MAELGNVSDGHVSDAQDSTPRGRPPRTPPTHGHAASDPAALAHATTTARDSVDPIQVRQAELEEAQRDLKEQQNNLYRKRENLRREIESRESRGGNARARARDVFRCM